VWSRNRDAGKVRQARGLHDRRASGRLHADRQRDAFTDRDLIAINRGADEHLPKGLIGDSEKEKGCHNARKTRS
jgi:hypothetical protein